MCILSPEDDIDVDGMVYPGEAPFPPGTDAAGSGACGEGAKKAGVKSGPPWMSEENEDRLVTIGVAIGREKAVREAIAIVKDASFRHRPMIDTLADGSRVRVGMGQICHVGLVLDKLDAMLEE